MEGPTQSHSHYLSTDFMRFYGHDCRLKTKNIAIRQINQHFSDIVKMILTLLFHLFIAVIISDDYRQTKQMWAKRITAQKMKFSLSIFKQETADLVTFTEEIYNGKLHFLCSGYCFIRQNMKDLDKTCIYHWMIGQYPFFL